MKVLVVGSLNVDVTLKVDHFPQAGETLFAESLATSLGGKGANQAFALARVGAQTSFVGMLGNDSDGVSMITEMQKSNIDTKFITKSNNLPTGKAFITIDSSGQNDIIVVSGANSSLSNEDINFAKVAFQEVDAVLSQLEVPIETVYCAMKTARDFGKLTILNPAPFCTISDELLSLVDILIPNEVELEQFTGKPIHSEQSLKDACEMIVNKGVKIVVVTLGKNGCYCYANGKGVKLESYKVSAVDTTAAGDSFIGGFLFEYLRTKQLETAIDFGQKVASIAVSRYGAVSSIPTFEEVAQFYPTPPIR